MNLLFATAFRLSAIFLVSCQIVSADLWFREDFTETPPEVPVQQKHLANPDLLLHRHGPGEGSVKRSFHANKPGDPHYVWSGLCKGNWAISFENKKSCADLSHGRVRWRTKQGADRILYVVLKTSGGWMVSGEGTAASKDWIISEILLGKSAWYTLDIQNVAKGEKVAKPDLAGVKAVGCTDLMPGGKSNACSRLDWIEVYKKRAPLFPKPEKFESIWIYPEPEGISQPS